ncbi:MAG: hypothetical protein ACK5W8_13570 [Pseudanabaena sp.]|jgi:hypothetical protein
MTKTQAPRALPHDVADEIFTLTPSSKAMLLMELSDEVNENLDGSDLLLSATSTQWLKALSILESLQLIQVLSQSILLDLTQ